MVAQLRGLHLRERVIHPEAPGHLAARGELELARRAADRQQLDVQMEALVGELVQRQHIRHGRLKRTVVGADDARQEVRQLL